MSVKYKKFSLLFALLLSYAVSAMENQESKPSSMKLIKITENNKNGLVEMMMGMYNQEGCGICRQPGAEVFWFSPYSRCAHKNCFDLVANAEKDLMSHIQKNVKKKDGYGEQNNAHIKAVAAVQQKIKQEGESSIKGYLEKYGETSLKTIFDTDGLNAIKESND
jgi:hypothetical protein